MYIHVHPYESKPFIHKYAKVLIYIACKGAHNQNSIECNPSLNRKYIENTSLNRI